MGTITLPSANTVYQLAARLLAVDSVVRTNQFNANALCCKCQFLTLQANPDGLAAARYYVGNEGLSTTHYGVVLFATQVWPIYSMDSNLIRLDQIYLMSNQDNETINVSFISR